MLIRAVARVNVIPVYVYPVFMQLFMQLAELFRNSLETITSRFKTREKHSRLPAPVAFAPSPPKGGLGRLSSFLLSVLKQSSNLVVIPCIKQLPNPRAAPGSASAAPMEQSGSDSPVNKAQQRLLDGSETAGQFGFGPLSKSAPKKHPLNCKIVKKQTALFSLMVLSLSKGHFKRLSQRK